MGAEQSAGDRYSTNPAFATRRARGDPNEGEFFLRQQTMFNPSAGYTYKPPKPSQQQQQQQQRDRPRPIAGSFVPGVFQSAPPHKRPQNSPTETERSDSIASLTGSEASGSSDNQWTSSPTGARASDGRMPEIVRSSSKSAAQEAAEVAAGMVQRSTGERAAARAIFVEHLKAMQIAAEKNGSGSTPDGPAKQWKKWESVQTNKDVYKMGRYDVVTTQLLGKDVRKADACASVSFYRGIDEELAEQDSSVSGVIVAANGSVSPDVTHRSQPAAADGVLSA